MIFELSEEQTKSFNEWRKTLKKDETTIGGGFTFEFIPTSLGTCVSVRHISGARLELTDYSTF
jgi:hypothetical protein